MRDLLNVRPNLAFAYVHGVSGTGAELRPNCAVGVPICTQPPHLDNIRFAKPRPLVSLTPRIRYSALLPRVTAFCAHIVRVILSRSEPKVLRVDTPGGVATVEHPQSFGYGRNKQLMRDISCTVNPTFVIQLPVPLLVLSPLPQPARIGFVRAMNLREETVEGRSVHHTGLMPRKEANRVALHPTLSAGITGRNRSGLPTAALTQARGVRRGEGFAMVYTGHVADLLNRLVATPRLLTQRGVFLGGIIPRNMTVLWHNRPQTGV
jgi:hypothetical protein